jgi:hypothetical protein
VRDEFLAIEGIQGAVAFFPENHAVQEDYILEVARAGYGSSNWSLGKGCRWTHYNLFKRNGVFVKNWEDEELVLTVNLPQLGSSMTCGGFGDRPAWATVLVDIINEAF